MIISNIIVIIITKHISFHFPFHAICQADSLIARIVLTEAYSATEEINDAMSVSFVENKMKKMFRSRDTHRQIDVSV